MRFDRPLGASIRSGMPRIGTGLARAACVLVLAGAAVGCGSPTLDTQKLQADLATQIEDKLNATGLTVKCPADVEVVVGTSFQCTAGTGDGFEATVRVTIQNDVPDVRWKIVNVTGSPSPTASPAGG